MDLLDIAERPQAAGAGLRSLSEPWADTTSPADHMVLTGLAGIAEFERSLIVDRTRRGREAARRRGVRFGRPTALSAAQIEHARELLAEGRTVADVAELLGVHRATLYRALGGQETSHAEARAAGAFIEDAMSEADVLAAADLVEGRQEDGPGEPPSASLIVTKTARELYGLRFGETVAEAGVRKAREEQNRTRAEKGQTQPRLHDLRYSVK